MTGGGGAAGIGGTQPIIAAGKGTGKAGGIKGKYPAAVPLPSTARMYQSWNLM